MSTLVALMSMSLDGFVAGLGDPTVVQGVGVTHLRYPVRRAQAAPAPNASGR